MKGSAKFSTDIRREQIAQATLRIIAEKGVSSLTTALIANEVGISEGNLYRHFRSKEEILSVTVEKISEGLRKNLDKVFESSTGDTPLAQLKKIYLLHLEYIEKNEGIPRLVFSEEIHLGNNELKNKLLSSINSYSNQLETLIKDGQKNKSIKKEIDPKAAAFVMIGMVQVTVMRWSLSGFGFPLVNEGMKLWRNYEHCIVQA